MSFRRRRRPPDGAPLVASDLLALGASVEVGNRTGLTPLFLAMDGDDTTTHILVKAATDPNDMTPA